MSRRTFRDLCVCSSGKAGKEADLSAMTNVEPLFDAIVTSIPAPVVHNAALQLLVVNVTYDSYKGHIAIGPLLSAHLRRINP